MGPNTTTCAATGRAVLLVHAGGVQDHVRLEVRVPLRKTTMTYAHWLRDREVEIYLFHGVTYPHGCAVRNYTRKHLDVDYFATVLRRLKASGNPVSMEQIRQHYEGEEAIPSRAFAVTFDDGFENNLTVAAPVLVEEGIPATFYVTTRLIEENRMLWIDRIEYAMEMRPAGRLKLPCGERAFNDGQGRRDLLNEIRVGIKQDPSMDPDAVATDIQEQLGIPLVFSSDHALDKKLTWDQVKALAAEQSFIVGGHSHTHRILAYLSEPELEQDIETSLVLLREKAGIQTVHYSYPEGLSYCYSDRVIEVLKRFGIRCCPSAEAGTNGPKADLFHLKRIMVV